MEINTCLKQQQAIKLTITQELSQAIELLQYSSIELLEYLENEALENPLIKIENIEYEGNYRINKKGNFQSSIDKDRIEMIGDTRFTLENYIDQQILDMNLSHEIEEIIRYYAQFLDDNGYFTGDLEEISKYFTISLSEAKSYLSILQQVEPAGIGARNLQECLLLQLRRESANNILAEFIISDYFIMFTERRWKELAKVISTDIKEIQKIFDYISNLNPKPGSLFYYESPQYIIPDAVIVKEGDNFVVNYFNDVLSKIRYNTNYFNNLSSYHDEKVNKFLHEKKQGFQWIIRSLEQRKKTIINVIEKIVEKQPQYFKDGPDNLKPMTMKEIAVELGIHESTVSRTVREKYLQTPFGVVLLKSLFTNIIESVSEEGFSSKKVKKALEKIIKFENKLKPFSDFDLSNLLKEKEGIIVSRRTVSKYREQLGISSSSKRKRYD